MLWRGGVGALAGSSAPGATADLRKHDADDRHLPILLQKSVAGAVEQLNSDSVVLKQTAAGTVDENRPAVVHFAGGSQNLPVRAPILVLLFIEDAAAARERAVTGGLTSSL